MIATLTLNPSIDQHIIVRGLVKDDANRAARVWHTPGGKGVNVSKAVRELGGRTRAYALAGGFTGKYWKHLVRGLDIPFTVMPVNGETRINAILTDLKDRTQTRVSAPGPHVSERALADFLKMLLAVRPVPAFWALGGSLAAGMPPATYRRFILALQKSGARCVLDADNDALARGVEAAPYLIKPNEYEMQRLMGRPIRSLGGYLDAARRLVKRGVRVVTVSLGAKGALFVNGKSAIHVLTPAVPVKSKVGAGDCLIGGFLFGLERNMDFVEAARLGVASSTSAVMREAPRLFLGADIRPLMARIKARVL